MPGDVLDGVAAWFFAADPAVGAFGVGLLLVGAVLIVLVARRVRLDRRRRAVRQATILARRVAYAQGRVGWTAPSFRSDETAVMYRVPEVWPTDPGRTALIPRQRGVGRG